MEVHIWTWFSSTQPVYVCWLVCLILTLWEFPSMLFVIFPFFLSIFFAVVVSSITVCLSVFFLEFILPGTPCNSWTWLTYLFSHVLKVFRYYHFKLFLRTFLSRFSFCDPYNVNVGVLNVVLEVTFPMSQLLT